MRRKLLIFLMFLGMNLFIFGVGVGTILYTLTYTSVPVQEAHEFYAKDLATYLTFQHGLITTFTVVSAGVANAAAIYVARKD